MSTDKKANKTGQSLFTSLFSDSSSSRNQANKSQAKNDAKTDKNTVDSNAQAQKTAPSSAQQRPASSKPTASAPPKKSEPAKAKEVRTVDVVIAGTTYPINCPADEKEELDKAALYINHFIREIRKNAPTLGHENLLVLCCLNMYEEMTQQKNTEAAIRENDKKMQALIAKVTKDAKSIID